MLDTEAKLERAEVPTGGRYMDYVKIEREDGIAVLTVDRQEKLNALDRQVLEEIGQALLDLESEGPRAIVVTGAGSGPLSPVPT